MGWVRVGCSRSIRRFWRLLFQLVLFTSCRWVPTWPLVIFLVPHGVVLFTHGIVLVIFGAIATREMYILSLALSYMFEVALALFWWRPSAGSAVAIGTERFVPI